MKFYEKLQVLRKENNMTQFELAEKMMVSRQAISKWETGSAIPDIENMIRISDLFGVSLDYLARDAEATEEQENLQSHSDKDKMQPYKKSILARHPLVTLDIISIVIIFAVGWQMHAMNTSIILTILIIKYTFLFWLGKIIITLFLRALRKEDKI